VTQKLVRTHTLVEMIWLAVCAIRAVACGPAPSDLLVLAPGKLISIRRLVAPMLAVGSWWRHGGPAAEERVVKR